MQMKKDSKNEKRILARRVATPVATADLKAVAGGGTTCSCGCADDCGRVF
jgi:hypothetical protein